MLLIALQLATASLTMAPPAEKAVVISATSTARPDGGKRKDGHDDEDAR